MTWVLAQTATDPAVPQTILTFLQYGVLGGVVVALLRGWLWARPSVQQLLDSITRLTNENQALRSEVNSLRDELREARLRR
jgi:hypothetical protein